MTRDCAHSLSPTPPHHHNQQSGGGFLSLLPSATELRDAAATAAAAAATAADGGGHHGAYRPPWLPRMPVFCSPLLRLHTEVAAFVATLEPTPEEADSRAASMDALRAVVQDSWPTARLLVFGSYATGLYTPASDTDVVVVDSGLSDADQGLVLLARALTQRGLVRNMQQARRGARSRLLSLVPRRPLPLAAAAHSCGGARAAAAPLPRADPDRARADHQV